MQATLEGAVDDVYAAFAHWRRPTAIDHCTHCVGPEAVERLLAAEPLREVPAETLRFYAVDALSTAGSAADFRYFLPRILHLAVTDGFDGWPDHDVVIGKFALAGWRRWPVYEQQAVTAFLHAWWRTTLTRFPAEPGAEELLGAIGRVEEDLGPYLRAWEAALATHAGASHLLEFVRDNFGRRGTRRWLHTHGWPDAATATVRTWLGDLSTAVAATAETVTDEETFDVLLELLDLL
jgi:hypothetical protein